LEKDGALQKYFFQCSVFSLHLELINNSTKDSCDCVEYFPDANGLYQVQHHPNTVANYIAIALNSIWYATTLD